jgi:chemotaxis protein MotB
MRARLHVHATEDRMRNLMLVVGVLAVIACGGPSKEQYAAKDAEAAKYKQAMQDESGKAAALEAKAKSLEEQNAALQTQVGQLNQQVTETGAAKSELEVTAAEYAKVNKELQGNQTIKLNDRLLFAENSSKLTTEAKRALDATADALRQVKDKHVIVAGYTDDTEAGGKTGAVKRWQLSTARALEIAKYLSGRGLDPARIAVAGFGASRPVAPNDSREKRALNRRAEIALTPLNPNIGTVDVKPATIKK